MGKLNGKVALVTGAASGIGEATAKLFASEGAAIGLLDIDGEAASALAAELSDTTGASTSTVTADVSDEAAVEAAIAKVAGALGDIDILVNCAGVDNTSPLHEMSTEMWDRMIAIHLRGTFLTCRAVLPAMKRKGWGRIILFSSQLAHKGAPVMAHYCAAKAGIMGFTRALSYEVAAEGITVNCINPGPIDTPLLRGLPDDWLEMKKNELPIKRFGRVDEVAPTILLLASDEGSYFVGASLNMNGGDYMI
ncbi:MAG: SDR family NAD(P)-dependent oxidoreductase [Devosia sp.]